MVEDHFLSRSSPHQYNIHNICILRNILPVNTYAYIILDLLTSSQLQLHITTRGNPFAYLWHSEKIRIPKGICRAIANNRSVISGCDAAAAAVLTATPRRADKKNFHEWTLSEYSNRAADITTTSTYIVDTKLITKMKHEG